MQIPDELVAAMQANPLDPEPFLVSADWLQSRGDPLGEWIVIQARRLERPDDTELRLHEARYFEEHAPHLLGGAVDHLDGLALDWRLGFLRSIRMESADTLRAGNASDVLCDLLAHPASTVVQDLGLGRFYWRDTQSQGDPQELVDQVVERGLGRSLRSLLLFDNLQQHDGPACNVTDWVRSAPRLETLTLFGESALLDAVSAPMKRLSLHGHSTARLEKLSASGLPQLEELEVWFDGPPPAEVWDRFLSSRFPCLRTLRLRALVTGTGELLESLSQAELWGQLQTLEFSMGELDARGAGILADSALESIDLTGTWLPIGARRRLKPGEDARVSWNERPNTVSTHYWRAERTVSWDSTYLGKRAQQACDGDERIAEQARILLDRSAGAAQACWWIATNEYLVDGEDLDKAAHLLELCGRWCPEDKIDINRVAALDASFDWVGAECVARFRRRAHPRVAAFYAAILQSLASEGRMSEALEEVEKVRAIQSPIISDAPWGDCLLVRCMLVLVAGGRASEAREMFAEFIDRGNWAKVRTVAFAALVQCHDGDLETAEANIRDHLRSFREPVMHHLRACTNMLKRRRSRAREQLAKLRDVDYEYAWFVTVDPILAELDEDSA